MAEPDRSVPEEVELDDLPPVADGAEGQEAAEAGEGAPAMSRVARWSRSSTMGMALRGAALGFEGVLRPDPDRPVIVQEAANGQLDDKPVRLYFVPNSPELTVAVVRPWLFADEDL